MKNVTITITLPESLCQKVFMGAETMDDVWKTFDAVKKEIKKQEASIALASPTNQTNLWDFLSHIHQSVRG
jgi:hypothetical protein